MVTRILALAGAASGSVSVAANTEVSTEAARQEPRGVWRKDILPKNILIPGRILTPNIKSLLPNIGSIKTASCNTTMLAAVALLACAVRRNGERIMAALSFPAPRQRGRGTTLRSGVVEGASALAIVLTMSA